MSEENTPSGKLPRDGAASGDDSASNLLLNRRDFMVLGAAAAAVACSSDRAPAPDGHAPAVASLEEAIVSGSVSFDYTFTAVRKEDFLVLKFEFLNLVPDLLRLVLQRKAPGDALVVITFPSQSVFEAAFSDSSVAQPPNRKNVPVGARLSGPSRVAFTVPNTVANVPLTLEGILQLVSQLDLHVAVNALPAGHRNAVLGGTQTTPLQLTPAFPTTGSLIGRVVRFQRDVLTSLFFPLLRFPPPAAETGTSIPATAPQPPFNHETSIEIPFRLLLSPDKFSAWAHSPTAVKGPSGRYELWHSRLGVRAPSGGVDESDPTLRRLRALWTRDLNFNPTVVPGFLPLTDNVFSSPTAPPPPAGAPAPVDTMVANDRVAIVHLTSNFAQYTTVATPTSPDPLPRPVHANRLILSALGGYLDVRGEWPDPATSFDLVEWDHRATLGRDHYVRLVKKGYLYPFGHRAVVVEVSERKFLTEPTDTQHERIAFLRKRIFIVVTEPEKSFKPGRGTGTDSNASHLRQLPFTAIRVRTLVTPNLDWTLTPTTPDVPRVATVPFRFALEAADVDGNLIRLDSPVAWIPDFTPTLPLDIGGAASAFDALGARSSMKGQRIAYAMSEKPDDTTYETVDLAFDSKAVSDPSYATGIVPVVKDANLNVEAIRHLIGEADATTNFTYDANYLANDFLAGNEGHVILATTTPISVDLTSDTRKSGGFIAPSFAVQALSRRIGPVASAGTTAADYAKATLNQFDPTQFFQNLAGKFPKLFGYFNLIDLLDLKDDNHVPLGLDRAPKFLTKILTRAAGLVADADKLSDDLLAAKVPSSVEPIPSITALATNLPLAFADPTSAIAAGIPGNVSAVVAALANVSSAVAAQNVQPAALAADLVARASSLAANLPGIVNDLTTQIANVLSGAEFPKEIHTRFEWKGRVKSAPASDPIFIARQPEGLFLVADIRASTQSGGTASVDLSVTLEKFDIALITRSINFITLSFNSIAFRAVSGKKPDVSVDFEDFTFGGPLTFVNTIKDLIPRQGFTDPPSVHVDASGVTAGFTLAIPTIAIGVFSLENINLAAFAHMPWLGDSPLTFSFDFSTRDNPFNLTVALLGGGGYFGIEVSPQGIERLEAALEAGARISVDLGVASGSVSAMIGIYFRMQRKTGADDDVLLSGYFRLRGRMDVLGIISVSVEMSLDLSYDTGSHKVIGRASIEVDIDILFFSASVTVSCERRFAGSNGDPTFLDVMAPQGFYRPWDEYVAAFAA